jgi:hypothetical protein
MARARRKPGVQVDAGEGKPMVRGLSEVCPLCKVAYGAEISMHLQSHAPASLCQRCDEQDKGWRLDLDGVQYFRQDVSIFYCSGCGRYPAVEGSPEA